MPKIEVIEDTLYQLVGKRFDEEELISILTSAKAELDSRVPEEGLLKIELNDTNRPDLWSATGLARHLRIFLSAKLPTYNFFSTKEESKDWGNRTVEVDTTLKSIRPYITAFAVSGKSIDEPMLKDIIQSQEKLCWNYGRKRKSIAMGIYRSDLITYPVKYFAAEPDKTKFVPLGFERELTLREILTQHPKGVEFGYIVENFHRFPFLTDAHGGVLSLPPIINSARIGAVQVGDSELFIELTGTDYPSLLHATSIMACDLADSGFTILPVKTIYPYDTPYGREVVTPFYFQDPITLDLGDASKLLGVEITPEEAKKNVTRLGCKASLKDNFITVTPPEYRNDFLHPVDIIEDIMIGRGMETFQPIMPTEFTVGRLTREEEFARKVKEIMIGLGFQEMIYSYLGSRKDFIDSMGIPEDRVIRIENPMTEKYEYVRNSILPNLLCSESVSANAVYPHHIFEIGKIVYPEPAQNYGTDTRNYLGFLSSDRNVGFNEANSLVSAVFFYLSRDYALEETSDPRFIRGRAAEIVYNGKNVGIFGEIHPRVLENWGIQMPCTGCEIDLDKLLEE